MALWSRMDGHSGHGLPGSSMQGGCVFDGRGKRGGGDMKNKIIQSVLECLVHVQYHWHRAVVFCHKNSVLPYAAATCMDCFFFRNHPACPIAYRCGAQSVVRAGQSVLMQWGCHSLQHQTWYKHLLQPNVTACLRWILLDEQPK